MISAGDVSTEAAKVKAVAAGYTCDPKQTEFSCKVGPDGYAPTEKGGRPCTDAERQAFVEAAKSEAVEKLMRACTVMQGMPRSIWLLFTSPDFIKKGDPCEFNVTLPNAVYSDATDSRPAEWHIFSGKFQCSQPRNEPKPTPKYR